MINGSISHRFSLIALVDFMVYQTINAAAVQANPQLSAAELHGMATGMLCGNANAQSADWLAEALAGGGALPDDRRQLLERMFEESRRLLAGDDFEFDLLLPDDETDLEERVTALKSWCQGFLYGVGMAAKEQGLDSEVREIIHDIGEFTKLDSEAEGEEDEQAYMEITEYLRAAVLMARAGIGQKLRK